MNMGHIFAIGDIHGCYDKLIALMDQLDIRFGEDRVVFLGDYVDRGPDVYQVMDFLVQFKEDHPGTIFLKGNHEAMLLNYLAGGDKQAYLINGGRQTLTSYTKYNPPTKGAPLPRAHLDFLNNLDLYYATRDYVFVHAGMRPHIPLEDQTESDLLWIRSDFIHTSWRPDQCVVYGHTPMEAPQVRNNRIGIDTGAVYGGTLTCVKLPEQIFFHA
jgi:serine/threonine protein phosphatase 1